MWHEVPDTASQATPLSSGAPTVNIYTRQLNFRKLFFNFQNFRIESLPSSSNDLYGMLMHIQKSDWCTLETCIHAFLLYRTALSIKRHLYWISSRKIFLLASLNISKSQRSFRKEWPMPRAIVARLSQLHCPAGLVSRGKGWRVATWVAYRCDGRDRWHSHACK